MAHVFNSEKERYLKFDLKKDYIRGMSEAICVSLGDRFFYAESEFDPREKDSVKHHLNEFALER